MCRSVKGIVVITKIKKIFVPLIIIIGLLLSLSKERFDAPLFWLNSELKKNVPTEQVADFSSFQMQATPTVAVHSATSVELKNGNILAMWYGGSREGHVDVALYSAEFNQREKTWSEPKKVLDRHDVANDLNRYIKKIGNPVLIKHPQGPIVLIYVSVSLAGWATSQLNMALSYDDGQSWHASKRLVTSPFINISTLVKNDAVIYQDGSIGISGYHELLGEFSEMIRVTLAGEVVEKYRMSHGDNTIQPTLVVKNEHEAFSIMRDSSRDVQRAHYTSTQDGGVTWNDFESLNVQNSNSAVFAFSDAEDRSWMVYNDQTRDMEHSRNNLVLAVSSDGGKTWKNVHYFENKELNKELAEKFAYPWVQTASNGEYHLFYTWSRKQIKHSVFNQAWLETLL